MSEWRTIACEKSTVCFMMGISNEKCEVKKKRLLMPAGLIHGWVFSFLALQSPFTAEWLNMAQPPCLLKASFFSIAAAAPVAPRRRGDSVIGDGVAAEHGRGQWFCLLFPSSNVMFLSCFSFNKRLVSRPPIDNIAYGLFLKFTRGISVWNSILLFFIFLQGF